MVEGVSQRIRAGLSSVLQSRYRVDAMVSATCAPGRGGPQNEECTAFCGFFDKSVVQNIFTFPLCHHDPLYSVREISSQDSIHCKKI